MKIYILWFIKFVIPILGFGLTIWSIFFISEDRQLSYEILSTTEIGSLKSEYLPSIQITYGGESIERGGIVTIRIINTGESPIYAREFDGPIQILLDDNSRFVDSKVVDAYPKNLNPSLSIQKGEINIAPLLLNSNDRLTVQAIAKGNLENIHVLGRIGGIFEITDLGEGKRALLFGVSWLLVLFSLLCFISYSLVGPVVLGGKFITERIALTRQGRILIVTVVTISGVIALLYFADMHSIGLGWKALALLFGLLIAAEIFSTPFRAKGREETDE